MLARKQDIFELQYFDLDAYYLKEENDKAIEIYNKMLDSGYRQSSVYYYAGICYARCDSILQAYHFLENVMNNWTQAKKSYLRFINEASKEDDPAPILIRFSNESTKRLKFINEELFFEYR